MYFPDMTPYIKSEVLGRCHSVGWLDKGHSYSTGQCDPQFITNLTRLVFIPFAPTSGIHACSFCGRKNCFVAHGDFLARLGTDVIAVPEIGRSNTPEVYFIAPKLILHYCVEHNYLPPKPFVDSVLGLNFDRFDVFEVCRRVFPRESIWVMPGARESLNKTVRALNDSFVRAKESDVSQPPTTC